MNIAVASADFATVTAHAGHARRFLVFEVESGAAPRNVARIELLDGMTIHEFSGEGPHPFDGLGAVIVGSAGEGFVRRGSFSERLIRSQEYGALEAADAIVVATAGGRAELTRAFPGLDARKITVIPNPVEIAHARTPVSRADLGVSDDAYLVLVACRLKRIKRLDLLIEAAERAHDEIPRLRLVIAGAGYARRRLVRMIRQRGLEDVVVLLGKRADVPDLMKMADVVALTSERESFGRALAEGASVGRPLVAFDAGGVADIVIDGQTGLLIPFGDVEGFAAALPRLARDTGLRDSLGAAGRRHAALFAPEIVTSAYIELFERLCANGSVAESAGVAAAVPA